MSRVGKLPVALPQGVTAEFNGKTMTVKGKKGQLSLPITSAVNVKVENNEIVVQPANDSKVSRAMWGTTRANVRNMVVGVTDGFTQVLEVKGVGYRLAVAGKALSLSLGFSHEVRYAIPEGIEMSVDKQTILTISGINKQLVGQVAAEIRELRKPEPYKGKGVRYQGEYVPMKEGKKK
jgi:large subunit ribosomal protein L6